MPLVKCAVAAQIVYIYMQKNAEQHDADYFVAYLSSIMLLFGHLETSK